MERKLSHCRHLRVSCSPGLVATAHTTLLDLLSVGRAAEEIGLEAAYARDELAFFGLLMRYMQED